jgi:hypothetical protein
VAAVHACMVAHPVPAPRFPRDPGWAPVEPLLHPASAPGGQPVQMSRKSHCMDYSQQGRRGREAGMSEPLDESTGDAWTDAYLTFRRAWLDGATELELADLAMELKRGLPDLATPVPAAMFIHSDILINSRQSALPARLVTALWVPELTHGRLITG